MAKSIGIIGGLGPRTAFQFSQRINDRFTFATKIQPNLLLENLPVSDEMLERMTKGDSCPEILKLMLDSIHKLNSAGVDLIVIPCNTVHVFIDSLRNNSRVPILSIIEETTKICEGNKLKIMGILGSNTTIKQKLYRDSLSGKRIKTIMPRAEEQEAINDIIFRINRDKVHFSDQGRLLEIIQNLNARGAETVLLACTDLQQIIFTKDTTVPLMDSFAILEERVFRFLIEG